MERNIYSKPEIDFKEFNFIDSIASGNQDDVNDSEFIGGLYDSDPTKVSSELVDEGDVKDPWD